MLSEDGDESRNIFSQFFFLWFKQNLFIHCNHKLNKKVQETQRQYVYLGRVTYRSNYNYTDIYDGTMANCQKVQGNKTNQIPKQQQQNKTKNRGGGGGGGGVKSK